VEHLASATAWGNSKIGVDVELISSINIDNENFIERNFTSAEQEYCPKAPSSQASFAGRSSAKERDSTPWAVLARVPVLH